MHAEDFMIETRASRRAARRMILGGRFRPEPTVPLSVRVRREREAARPGDRFPNLGYVRAMTDRDEVPTASRLVGLIGKKRAGKDTFAKGLLERGFERFAFADPLKEAALSLDPLIGRVPLPGTLAPIEDVRLSAYVEAVGWEAAKEVPEIRRTLQRFGVGIRALDEGFWVRPLGRALEASSAPLVVTDVRFPNEADEIRRLGGRLVRIIRPGQESTDAHESETALDGYEADLDVLNVGDAEALIRTARALPL